MFWNRKKKEKPEVLDIAGLINEGDQQGKVYTTAADGRLQEACTYPVHLGSGLMEDWSGYACSGLLIQHEPTLLSSDEVFYSRFPAVSG